MARWLRPDHGAERIAMNRDPCAQQRPEQHRDPSTQASLQEWTAISATMGSPRCACEGPIRELVRGNPHRCKHRCKGPQSFAPDGRGDGLPRATPASVRYGELGGFAGKGVQDRWDANVPGGTSPENERGDPAGTDRAVHPRHSVIGKQPATEAADPSSGAGRQAGARGGWGVRSPHRPPSSVGQPAAPPIPSALLALAGR
eukprot:gene12718-biopygen3910